MTKQLQPSDTSPKAPKQANKKTLGTQSYLY